MKTYAWRIVVSIPLMIALTYVAYLTTQSPESKPNQVSEVMQPAAVQEPHYEFVSSPETPRIIEGHIIRWNNTFVIIGIIVLVIMGVLYSGWESQQRNKQGGA